jgi:hypothetical protein
MSLRPALGADEETMSLGRCLDTLTKITIAHLDQYVCRST